MKITQNIALLFKSDTNKKKNVNKLRRTAIIYSIQKGHQFRQKI